MSMQGCADTHIGDVLSRGISGGQAKRTNIGIALISKYGSARFRNAALMHDNRRAQWAVQNGIWLRPLTTSQHWF